MQDSTIATSNNGLSHKGRNKLKRRTPGVMVKLNNKEQEKLERKFSVIFNLLIAVQYKQNITVLIVTVPNFLSLLRS